MKKIALLLAALLMLSLPLGALADVRRGDSGDQVEELQQLLFDMGWISEEPDGVFGRRTEAALKEFQTAVGVEANGVADDEVMNLLYREWRHMFGDEEYVIPDACEIEIGYGAVFTNYCQQHLDIVNAEEALLQKGDLESVKQARGLWEDEVARLYGELLVEAEGEQKDALTAAYAVWKVSLSQQVLALGLSYGDDELAIEMQHLRILKAHAVELCGMLHELYPEGETEADGE